jgi:hypothetical protein
LLETEGIFLPFSLLHFLMSRLDFAQATPVRLPSLLSDEPEGTVLYRLDRVGSRVQIKEHEIALAMGVSKSTVLRGLKVLKDVEIVQNWGNGWIELCAAFVWKGNESIRRAYAAQQPRHKSRWRMDPVEV